MTSFHKVSRGGGNSLPFLGLCVVVVILCQTYLNMSFLRNATRLLRSSSSPGSFMEEITTRTITTSISTTTTTTKKMTLIRHNINDVGRPPFTQERWNNLRSLSTSTFTSDDLMKTTKWRNALVPSSSTETAPDITTTTSQSCRVVFLFTVGLEGTGHHRHSEFFHASPALQKLWGKTAREEHELLLLSLWDHARPPDQALLSWPSSFQQTTSSTANTEEKEKKFQRIIETAERLLRTQRAVTNRACVLLSSNRNNHYKDNNDVVFGVPLNSFQVYHLGGRSGMMSYPNFAPDTFPEIKLLAEACALAKVECVRQYIFRKPVESIHSAVVIRRYHGGNVTASISSYRRMISIMDEQLHVNEDPSGNFTSHKDIMLPLVGCWNYDGDDIVDKRISGPPPYYRSLFGFDDFSSSSLQNDKDLFDAWKRKGNPRSKNLKHNKGSYVGADGNEEDKWEPDDSDIEGIRSLTQENDALRNKCKSVSLANRRTVATSKNMKNGQDYLL